MRVFKIIMLKSIENRRNPTHTDHINNYSTIQLQIFHY